MDNLTHSLVGIAVAETVFLLTNSKNELKTHLSRKTYLILAVVAANFPDLDILFQLFEPTKLNYMLTHRGHTHTFWALFPQGGLVLGLLYFFCKQKKTSLTLFDGWVASGLVFINLFLHIGLDFLNTYGVHPFSPWDNRWYYGDVLHIIEPVLWLSLLPLAFFVLRQKAIKFICILFFIGIPVAFIKFQFMNTLQLLTICLLFLFLLFAFRFSTPRKRLGFSLLSFCLVALMFFTYKKWAEQKVNSYFLSQRGYVPSDVVLSPLPASPFCWYVIAIDIRQNNYSFYFGNLSHFNQKCQSFFGKNSLKLDPPFLKSNEDIKWLGSYQENINDLLAGYSSNCQLRSWMQFVRVPLKKDNFYLDYRFAIKSEKNISTIVSNSDSGQCPKIKTSWTPPRQDLIDLYLSAKQ